MRTYQLIIAYDGSRFRGWQRQPDTELTIQGILEKQISALAGYPVEVQGAGRTDGGVHAAAQTASIQLAGKIEPEYFREKLNQCLPEDIRVLGVKLMKNSFHARYSACGKLYEYAVDTGVRPNVFLRKYTFHYPEKLDIQKMRQAAAILEGTHDFTAFTDRPDEHSARRRIYQIQITESGNLVNIKYIGSGFMYHMVRILTGTLLEVGIGKRTPENVKSLLEHGVRAEAGFLAPACGLCVKRVYYEKKELRAIQCKCGEGEL